MFYYTKNLFILLFISSFLVCNTASAELKLKDFSIPSGRIVFTYIQGKQKDLYVIDFKELSIKPLVQTIASEEYPRWSPDGTKVLFYSNISGNREIYVVNSDKTGLTKLTNSQGADENPDWSPDGKKIVFQSTRSKHGTNIFIMNSDGSAVKALTHDRNKNSVPKWSPRGTEILYSTNAYWPGWDMKLYDIPTAKSTLLTHGFKSFCRGAWNPDGSQFAFSYGTRQEIDIWIEQKGKSPWQLTNLPGRDYDAVWSTNSNRIFFVNEITKGKGDYQLFSVNLKTKKTIQITEGRGAVRYPDWTEFPVLSRIGEPEQKPSSSIEESDSLEGNSK